ncbi:NAD(P)-binding protein [Athelia psychrophila]|uniref:NAD(P)-binding protein n=1 Tax=Athelia psychrophila TaxID=1759441 RepID=A0A166J5G3_9AGAM|nr:NAD(P)-binding protein [Fibularhizoctonia sp. CBS 109695]
MARASSGRNAFAVPADVSQEDQVKKTIESAAKTLGGLDIMVANAGICCSTGSLIENQLFSTSVCRGVGPLLRINVNGVCFCYKYAGNKWLHKDVAGGSLALRLSWVNQSYGSPLLCHEICDPWPLTIFAQELGPHRITVNTYAPGVIDTPMTQAGDAVLCKQLGVESGMAHMAAATPAGYLGKPEDVASPVSYLASKEAHFITGQGVNSRHRDWLVQA